MVEADQMQFMSASSTSKFSDHKIYRPIFPSKRVVADNAFPFDAGRGLTDSAIISGNVMADCFPASGFSKS